jgi:hypothetical protein
MARDIDLSKPLSADDIVYLRSRYSSSYLEHALRVSGTDESVAADAVGPSAEETAEALEKAAQDAEDARLKAEAEAAEAAAEAEAERQRQEAEDLIGGAGDFDVLGATEAEVKAWAATASDEDKAAALEAEQSREDRDPRKGVVSLLG